MTSCLSIHRQKLKYSHAEPHWFDPNSKGVECSSEGTHTMKNVILTLGVVLSLAAGPAFAVSSGVSNPTTLETLSDAQTDALVAILSGLPRQ
jgi:hypothetical protein